MDNTEFPRVPFQDPKADLITLSKIIYMPQNSLPEKQNRFDKRKLTFRLKEELPATDDQDRLRREINQSLQMGQLTKVSLKPQCYFNGKNPFKQSYHTKDVSPRSSDYNKSVRQERDSNNLKLPFISLNSRQIFQNSTFVDQNQSKKLNSNSIDSQVRSQVQRKYFRDNIFKKIQEKCQKYRIYEQYLIENLKEENINFPEIENVDQFENVSVNNSFQKSQASKANAIEQNLLINNIKTDSSKPKNDFLTDSKEFIYQPNQIKQKDYLLQKNNSLSPHNSSILKNSQLERLSNISFKKCLMNLQNKKRQNPCTKILNLDYMNQYLIENNISSSYISHLQYRNHLSFNKSVNYNPQDNDLSRMKFYAQSVNEKDFIHVKNSLDDSIQSLFKNDQFQQEKKQQNSRIQTQITDDTHLKQSFSQRKIQNNLINLNLSLDNLQKQNISSTICDSINQSYSKHLEFQFMDDDKETEYNLVKRKKKKKVRQFKSNASQIKSENLDIFQSRIIEKMKSKYKIDGQINIKIQSNDTVSDSQSVIEMENQTSNQFVVDDSILKNHQQSQQDDENLIEDMEDNPDFELNNQQLFEQISTQRKFEIEKKRQVQKIESKSLSFKSDSSFLNVINKKKVEQKQKQINNEQKMLEKKIQNIQFHQEHAIPQYIKDKLTQRELRILMKQVQGEALFIYQNKNNYKSLDLATIVDKKYLNLQEFCDYDIKQLEKTTPFNRQQLFDLYTKFKSLSKISIMNREKRRQIEIKKDLIEKHQTGGDTPKLLFNEKADFFIKDQLNTYQNYEQVGVDKKEFMQGLKECRMYNQGILSKIFDSLDEGKKGYLNWWEFLGGMKIVCSKSDVDKVDLFLKMVDSSNAQNNNSDEGGDGFDFQEIKEICQLTFQDLSAQNEKDEEQQQVDEDNEDVIAKQKEQEEKQKILNETAEFQAKNIFRLLKYDLNEPIPIDVFKNAIFNGDEETQRTLRQFCCLE